MVNGYTKSHARYTQADQRACSVQRVRSAYKHVPHREKPPHLVARRNAYERRRVQAVNGAFVRLQRHLPVASVGKNELISKARVFIVSIVYFTGRRVKGL
jgi:Helix-loop-helix DNA-binding domain